MLLPGIALVESARVKDTTRARIGNGYMYYYYYVVVDKMNESSRLEAGGPPISGFPGINTTINISNNKQ